jgi:cobalt-zinc-cadmium efflux system protein
MTPDPARPRATRPLTLAILITATFLVVEVAGGIVSGSLALISDAGHMLTDLLALVLSLMAARFAALPANHVKTYGYHRLEILTALVNGSFLVLVAGTLAYKAFRRFSEPVPIDSPIMVGVALGGLAANITGLWLLSGHGNLNVRGARMHIMGDALSSAGVVIAAIVIAFTGWYRLDPVIAGIVAIVIAVGAVRLVREAVDVLLEAAPAGLAIDDVRRAIAAVPGVVEVHDLHVWSITTGLPALSGHVRVDAGAAGRPDETLDRIALALKERFGILHTTLQLESPAFCERCDVSH